MDDLCLVFDSPDDDHKMVYIPDSMHGLKNGRTAMLNSNRDADGGAVRKDGNIIDWMMPKACWKMNEQLIRSGRPMYFQNITRNVGHPPNNWALQKVNYVLPLLQSKLFSKIRAQLEREPPNVEFVGCEGAVEYLHHLAVFAACAVSFKMGSQNAKVWNKEHTIFGVIEAELKWWEDWMLASKNEPARNRCIADVTYFAIVAWYKTWPVLVDLQFAENEMLVGIERYTCPMRVTQNGLESLFGEMKCLGGCHGGLYGFQVKKAASRKQNKCLCARPSSAGTKKGQSKAHIASNRNINNP